MLLTFFFSLLVAITNYIDQHLPSYELPPEGVRRLLQISWCFITASEFTLLSVLVTRFLRFGKPLESPGHWLVLSFSAIPLESLMSRGWEAIFNNNWQFSTYRTYALISTTISFAGSFAAAAAMLFFLKKTWTQASLRWRYCVEFILLTLFARFVMDLFACLGYMHPVFVSWNHGAIPFVAGIAVAICVWKDRTEKVTYDWVHWASILIFLLNSVDGFVSVLMFYYYVLFYGAVMP